MDILKVKVGNEWVGIPAIKGDTGATGAQGPQGATGATGAKGDTGNSGVYCGETAPTDPNVNVWINPTDDETAVTDVQLNGTSVVTNGVANVPVASTSDYGVLKIGYASSGLQKDSSGYLKTLTANANQVKEGTEGYRPIVPSNQHESAFYGLAKAAGNSDQSSSSNAVGTYTEDAKVKIQKMLGIYEAPWELIREDAVTCATESNIDITVDDNGSPFELTDIRMIIWFPVQNNDVCYDSYHISFNPNAENYVATIDKRAQTAGSSVYSALAMIDQKDGMITTFQCAWGSVNANSSAAMRRTVGKNEYDYSYKLANVIFNHIRLNKVTGTINFRIYGKRKWT